MLKTKLPELTKKQKLSDLSKNQREIINKIEKGWNVARFIKLDLDDDGDITFIFIIPIGDILLYFYDFTYDVKTQVYKNRSKQEKVHFGLA